MYRPPIPGSVTAGRVLLITEGALWLLLGALVVVVGVVVIAVGKNLSVTGINGQMNSLSGPAVGVGAAVVAPTVTVGGAGVLDLLPPPQPATASTAASNSAAPASFRIAILRIKHLPP